MPIGPSRPSPSLKSEYQLDRLGLDGIDSHLLFDTDAALLDVFGRMSERERRSIVEPLT
jgi:hypothetical protein